MQTIKEILLRRLKHHKLDPSASAAEICFYADHFMRDHLEDALVSHVKAHSLKAGVLVIGVSHSAVAEAFRPISDDLLSSIQERFGGTKVTRIITRFIAPSDPSA